jgi:hypothetical protein
MPKYDVQICQEVWKYYRIHIDAPSVGLATAKAEDIFRKTGLLEFTYEPGEDDGHGAVVVDCTEMEDGRQD